MWECIGWIVRFKPEDVDVTRRLSWRPYIKPTANHVPLRASSNHSKGIHAAWPVTEVARMHRLSCTAQDFHVYRDIKLNSLAFLYAKFHQSILR